MDESFNKFQERIKRLPVNPTVQEVQQMVPVEPKSAITPLENISPKKRYPGTRQLNIDLEESLFIELKMKSLRERVPVRDLVKEAISEFLKAD